MQKQIFVINGSGGVGKDTFCTLVALRHTAVFMSSSIDPVKTVARYLDWDDKKKTEKDRKFLSDLKHLMIGYNDFPMKYLQQRVNAFNKSTYYEVMFIHIREPEEIEKAVKAFGAKTLLITAGDRVKPITTNHSDAEVQNYSYDYYLDNSGTIQDLEKAVDEFCHFYHIGC